MQHQQSQQVLRPKGVYEPVAKLEPFYTGGAVRVTRDHQHMACACGEEVKVCWQLAARSFAHACRSSRRWGECTE